MTEQKHYRYRKVTPEILEEMKDLRASGLTQEKIAKKFNITNSTVQYWTNPQQKEDRIRSAKKSNAKLTTEQRKEKTKKHSEYNKKYFLGRYNNDEEFRKRIIQHVKDYIKKRREKRISEGNCSTCGRERENKKYKMCEKCREKRRRDYQKNK